MIKLAYDYQAFTLQKYGGISRYLYELASAIARNNDFDVNVYAGLYQNKYLLADRSNLNIKGWQTLNLPIPRRVLAVINNQLNKLSFGMDLPDIIHETYYLQHSNAPTQSKIVLTVYDMIHEKIIDPEIGRDFIKIKSHSIQRADRIICISENTRKDLLELFDLDPNIVTTVHLGYSPLKVKDPSPIIKEPYLLYVGDRESPYKNFNNLLHAYANSKQLQNCFKLVCFGSKSFSSVEIETISNLGIDSENIVHYAGDDLILANLYSHSSLFVYPSRYEGFGIPPLEAMSLDCPVACSNVSSIPEIVGDAGEYFDPDRVDSIVEAIEKVVFSTYRSKELKDKGEKRIEQFSWDKCAAETSLVYRSLM